MHRNCCPTSFLQDQDLCSDLADELSDIRGGGYAWWAAALGKIRKTAIGYEISNHPQGYTEVQALLMECKATHLPGQAWFFLKQRGLCPKCPNVAYSLLASIAEQEQTDRTGQLVLTKLREALADPYEHSPFRKKHDV